MRESSIILVLLLQAAEELKYSPTGVPGEMSMPYRDLLVCGVSTRLNQYIQRFDDIISPTDVDFNIKRLTLRISNSS